MANPRLRKWLGRIAYLLFLGVIAFATIEIYFRATGNAPYQRPRALLTIEPDGSFFRPDSLLGYGGRPGTIFVSIDGEPLYSITHDAEGYRPTAYNQPTEDGRPEIWTLGCSFTHGYGVDDSATWPWHLQTRLPDFRIRNYAMSGYGSYQSLLQLRDLLSRQAAPEIVILGYGSFHHQRNVASRMWEKTIAGIPFAAGFTYPYLRFEDGAMQHYSEPLIYDLWPLQSMSAAVHVAEGTFSRKHESFLKADSVTIHIIDEIHALCEQHDAQFILAGIYDTEATGHMVDRYAHTIPALNISLTQGDTAVQLSKYDTHPNPHGHQILADRMLNFLVDYLPEVSPVQDSSEVTPSADESDAFRD